LTDAPHAAVYGVALDGDARTPAADVKLAERFLTKFDSLAI
jgi:hypothetical protein